MGTVLLRAWFTEKRFAGKALRLFDGVLALGTSLFNHSS